MEDQEYYTAEEAMKILHRTKTIFYRQVNAGEIPYEIEEGKKRGKMFPKLAIDTLAKIEAEERTPRRSSLSLTLSTIAERWEGMKITRQLYGPIDEVPFETLIRWASVNNEIFMSLKEGNKLIGAITFLPVDERTAISVINGNTKEKDIPATAIKKWTEPNISVYIPTIEVLPSGNIHRDRERGMFLLKHTIRWGVLMMIQHDIKCWYALGATPDGRTILEGLGFKAVSSLTNEIKGYKLEAKTEPVKLIGMYVKSLEGEPKTA